jgi:hypothetical protein
LQQVDELGVMIRREAGGSGGDGHGKTASAIRIGECRVF